MTGSTDLELMRLLRGELPPDEARRLRARMLREPELAAAYRRLEAAWRSLELPPPSPVPPGFSTRVMARVRESAAGRTSWASAPGWVRATAAAALVTGIAVGTGVGSLRPVPVPAAAPVEVAPAAAPDSPPAAVTPAPAPEAVPERSPETAPEPPIVASVTDEEAGGTGQEDLFDWDGDLADSYWEAVASLSTGESGDSGETGGALQ
jgi:hypothetical protein